MTALSRCSALWPPRRGPSTRAFLVAVLALVGSVRAADGQSLPADTLGLATGPFAEMHMLLEKTIFQVDVLTLRVRFDALTALDLEALAAGRRPSDALIDSLAAVAVAAQNVWARITFLRDVSLGQFLGGVREDMRRAVRAEILTSEEYDRISQGLPLWYAFLERRKIRRGDRMYYRIRGDTLRTVYESLDGEVLLDQVDIGPERRRSVLGSWFAPKSSFREKLLASLFAEGG